MNVVGIDVSKGKSTVAIIRHFGEVVASPFDVAHTDIELGKLAKSLLSLNGETKVIMECTGTYAGYRFCKTKSDDVYVSACGHVSVIPKNDITKLLITQAVTQVNFISETLAVINNEMKRLAALLPEYPVVSKFYGAGGILGSQLMAEIGDIHRFSRKESLVCFAGLEAPPYQSGKFESENRSISKKGSPHLRKALFQVMDCLLKHAPADEPVFQFLDRKRAEGKHYYSYMTAGFAKFLRIYYACVKEYLDNLDSAE